MAFLEPLVGDPRDTLFAGWFVDCFAQGSDPENSSVEVCNSPFCCPKKVIVQFKPHKSSVLQNSPNCCAPDTEERIEHEISLMTKCEDAPLHELNRELAWMVGFLRMIRLDIRNIPYFRLPVIGNHSPNVTGILSKRISS